MSTTPKPRVLCIDDEPLVLEGLKLHLHTRFDVRTAASGAAGLEMLRHEGPFAVVMSDMRMPGMDGAEFLAKAHDRSPHTVRMLLTGYADMDSAIAAVNDGHIFRFLTKPCPAPNIVEAMTAAAEQHRLIEAERVLLEQTLAGSIKMLTEVLSLSNPLLFGRAVRLKRLATKLCDRLVVGDRWHIEAAAQLSQIGCITLPTDLVEKLYYGRTLTPSEQILADRVPATADQLLANIPRLEPVREILTLHVRRYDSAPPGQGRTGGELPLGARILRLLIDYDRLEAAGTPASQALGILAQRDGCYDPELLTELRTTLGSGLEEVRELKVSALKPGMVFAEDVRSSGGMLLVARGHTVTDGLIDRMRNIPHGQVKEPIRVLVEPSARTA